MIYLTFIFFIHTQNYLDSLLLNAIEKNYVSESLKTIDSIEVKFIYRKDNLIRIEGKTLKDKEKVEEKIIESIKKELSSESVQKVAKRGTGLIPDITIPIPVELPFGLKEETKVKINGFQDLSMGLRRRSYSNEAKTTPQGSSSPEIQLNQRLRVNTEGIIGGKIHIRLDHDSERESQDLNTIKIRYEGDEDEIIKSIEGGNKIGKGGGGGLFGISAQFQLGPLNLNTKIAREVGNRKEIEFEKGGVEIDTLEIEDKDYVKDRFFILPLLPGEEIISDSVYIFYDDNEPTNILKPVEARTFLEDNPDSLSDKTYIFELLTKGIDWDFAFCGNVIQIKKEDITQNFRLAVYYKTTQRKIGYYNPNNQNDTAKLMLIRDVDLNDAEDPTWKYMLKNIYYIGELRGDSGSIIIYRDESSVPVYVENGKTFLQILGLDNNGDGVIDEQIEYQGVPNFIPYQHGYLFFPDPEPFASPKLSKKDTIIYKYRSGTEVEQRNVKYKIRVITQRRPEVINLGFTRIVEGSEEVYFGSEKWERGKDYIIDYETGTLTILNDEYKTDFSRKLKIKFNESALFQTKKRTTVTLNGNYDVGQNSKLNFGIKYRGESTTEQKPRFGEEPKRVLLINSNFNFQKEFSFNPLSFLPWLREIKSPLLKASFKFNQAFPDPNTRGSAYLDDMEATKLEIPISLSYTNWIYGSLPSYLKDDSLISPVRVEDDYVNKLIWVETNKFTNADIYPYVPGAQAKKTANVMKIIIRPGTKGDVAFASLTQLLSRDGFDLSSYDYIELIIKADKGIMGIDIGTEINEDALMRDAQGNLIGLGILNTEDGANGGPRDGQYEAIEDVGLDMAPDGSKNDAGNDNFDAGNIEKVNGTEGNGRLDTEDLNRNGFLDKEDHCFTYVINLEEENYDQINNGFKFYKIPLDKVTKIYGKPDIRLIKKIRIFFTGFDKTDTIYIARLSITGNRYVAKGIFNKGKPADSTSKQFTITTYSNQEDAKIYSPPPGVHIVTTSEGEEEERTLVLKFKNFEPNDVGIAIRQIPNYQDFWEYKKLKFYLKAVVPDTIKSLPTFFIRFASVDTSNYYEYRVKNVPKEWKEFEIDIEKFTQLKNKRGNKSTDTLYSDPSFPNYYVKGNPNFKKINKYIIGVKNESNEKMSGEVWFNELIITTPDRMGAYSFESSINYNLGEIGGLSFSYSRNSAGFAGENLKRQLNSQENLGGNISLNLNKLLNINFLNLSFGYSASKSKTLPIFLPSSDIKLTKEQSEREKSESFANSFSFSISRNLANKKTEEGLKDKIFKYTIDALQYSTSLQYSRTNTPLNKNYTRNFQQSLSYGITIPFKGIKILGQSINPLPQNIRAGVSYSKIKRKTLDFVLPDSVWAQTISVKREGGGLNYNIFRISPLNALKIDFGGKVDYDIGLKKLTGRFYGMDIRRGTNYSLRYNPTLPSFLRNFVSPLNFSYNATFNDEHDPMNQKDSLNPLRRINNYSSYSIQTGVNTFNILAPLIKLIMKLGNPKAMKDIDKLRYLFRNISITYTRNLSSRYYNLTKPPSFYYEIGRTMNPQIQYEENINNSIQDSRNIGANTGTKIFDIGVNVSGNYQQSFTFYPAQKIKTEDYTKNFPNISIQVGMLNKKIKILDRYLSNLSLKSSYNSTNKQNISSYNKTETKTTNFTPLFSIQGRTRNGVGFSISHTKTQSLRLKYSGSTVTEEKTLMKGIQASLDFSISKSLSKKLFGFMKIRSQVNASITFSHQNNKTIARGIERNNTAMTSLNGTLSFRFTEDITGSATMSYNNKKDNLRGTSNKDFGINFGVRINF